MKRGICDSVSTYQMGATLLEALVGLILMSLVGLGLSYAASRSLTSQRYLNTHNVVVSQARQWLLSKSSADITSACGGAGADVPGVTVGDQTVTLNIACETKTVVLGTVGGRGGTERSGGHELTVSINDGSVRTMTTLSTPEDNEAAKAIVGGDGRIEVKL